MKIYCKNTKVSYLVDSGANVSLIPREAEDTIDPEYQLRAANGSLIATYGIEKRWLEIGLDMGISHDFIKADVPNQSWERTS